MTSSFTFDAEVWLYRGPDPWHFLSLPAEVSDVVQERTMGRRNAFGSVRVGVAIGQTRWETSLFPDSGQKVYVLPLKKSVREAEDLGEGDVVSVEIELLG